MVRKLDVSESEMMYLSDEPTCVLGIDPGMSGAIAVLTTDGKYVSALKMPLIARGKAGKQQINVYALSQWIEQYSSQIAYMELVGAMPGQGVSSMFNFGESFGCVRGILGAFGIPIILLTPTKWKKFYGIRGEHAKEMARAKAQELFPQAPLSRKNDQGIAEALLMANYGVKCHV